MSEAIDRARAVIQSRLTELDAEAKKLEGALASMGERATPRPRRGRPKRAATAAKSNPRTAPKPRVAKRAPTASVKDKPRAPRKRKAAKGAPKRRGRKAGRAPRGQRREQLLNAVEANPGARPAELARAIGVKPAQAHNLIAKARREKLLVKKSKGYALRS
jgi:hypothetical protein